MLYATIMAGGAGTRFWPASRSATPKQLLPLTSRRSMLQATVDRLAGICPADHWIVMTNRILVAAVCRQLPAVLPEQIVGEPCKRDTAPCVALAASLIAARDPDATMLVMPADHVIDDVAAYQNAVRQATALIEDDPQRLVTFGIRPSYAAQVFGYIQRGAPLPRGAGEGPAFSVSRFHEKPDRACAEQYFASGDFYWNSGIFLWRAATILEAIRRWEPEMARRVAAISAAQASGDFDRVLPAEYQAIEPKSIDHAVLEKHEHVVVIEAPFDWDDLGSWTAAARRAGQDESGNSLSGRHLAIDTHNTMLHNDPEHLVVMLGVDQLIVVHTDDATLIAAKSHEQQLRKVVQELEKKGWTEYL